MKKLILLIFLLTAFYRPAHGNTLVDSLEKLLPAAGDSEKVMILNRLVTEYSTMNPDKAAQYCEQAVKLAEKTANPTLQVLTLISQCAVYNTKSNFDGALELGLKALKIAEQAKNNDLVARCYNNIGFIYQKLRDHRTALASFYSAEKLKSFLNDKKILGNLYNNFGNSYYELKELDSAMYYHKKALEIRLAINDMRGISYSYNNIGNVYLEQKRSDKALEFYIKSLSIKQEIGDKKGIAGGNINISGVYVDLKDYASAVRFAEKGVAQALEIHAKDFLLEGYDAVATAYAGLGNDKKANEYLRKYIDLKDSLYNDNIAMQIAEMQAKYESDKKQREIELQNTQLELKSAKVNSLEENSRKQQTIVWAATIGLILLLLAVGMVYSRFRIKKKANAQLEVANAQLQHLNEMVNSHNKEIERQSDEIRGKNKDITDSIVYARRIQSAIMPPVEELKSSIPDSFIYYKPRDIVSGDFYWFYRSRDLVVVACADCTGHGVPGAFMSMICVQLLNLVVRDRHVTATEQALQLLDEGVRRALHQSGSDHDTTDGMDIALCAFDLSNNTVQYSGAYRPLYVIRKGELIEVPANKFSIGGHKNIDKNFSGSKVLLEKGDMIYLFTDGFADQFGGKDGKKFKLKNFKKLLLSVCDKPVQEQHRIIERTMDDWKSNQQQLDDILVMGMRI